MHEYPIARQIVEIASKAAQEQGARAVSKIFLVVGDATGYLADCIKMYFDLIAADSICQGAEIEIERVKPLLRCETCGELFERKPFSFECPCGGQGRPTDIGREFYVKAIEVEENDPD